MSLELGLAVAEEMTVLYDGCKHKEHIFLLFGARLRECAST